MNTLDPMRKVRSLSGMVALGLASMGCGNELPDHDAHAVEHCSDLRHLLSIGALRGGERYQGESGFAISFLAGVTPATADIDGCEQLEQTAERLLAHGVPGASLAYRTRRYSVRLARGVADKATGEALRADALVRVASIGKSYVGSLAALLAVEGKLDLDNSDGAHALGDYLPEVVGQIEYADRITVRQLLNHTSGIPDYFGEALGPTWLGHLLESHRRGVPVSEQEALALVYGQPADFEPGSSATYSNTAYLLAGRVLDTVLGHPHQDEARRRFLDPLGLDDTYFEKHDAFDYARLSHGYRDASELGENFSDWYDVDQGYGFANGAIVARVDQIARFFRAVPGGRELPARVSRVPFLTTLRPAEPVGYGLGLERSGDCYFHSGTFAGYVAMAFHCEEQDLTGALFINSSVPAHEQALFTERDALMKP